MAFLFLIVTPLLSLGSPLTNFELKDDSGKVFQSKSLKGEYWIASFIFTRCQGQCPLIINSLKTLRKDLKKQPLSFVSLSADPTHDLPTVLKKYRTQMDLGKDWILLTGDFKKMMSIIEKQFLVPVFNDESGDTSLITHSDQLILVSPDMEFLGHYKHSDPELSKKILKVIKPNND